MEAHIKSVNKKCQTEITGKIMSKISKQKNDAVTN